MVSTDPGVCSIAAFHGRELPYAPHGSPAVPVLRSLLPDGGETIRFKPYEPRQLALMLVSGRVDSALIPEPLVTRLLDQVTGLRIVESVEEHYGKHTGGPLRMPIAGIAVNTRTADAYPRIIATITDIILQEARKLASDPLPGVNALPPAVDAFMTREQVRKSLARDRVLALPASEAAAEIETYLEFLMPGKTPAVDRLTRAFPGTGPERP